MPGKKEAVKRLKNWAHIVFKFEDSKTAYRMARWISMGVELGIVPATIEVLYADKRVVLGHDNADEPRPGGGSRATVPADKKD